MSKLLTSEIVPSISAGGPSCDMAIETRSLSEPLTFHSYFRPQVWGGRRLSELLHKSLPADQAIGESWELSAHPHHQSLVQSGSWRGSTLEHLWRIHRQEFTGKVHGNSGPFPWLIKWLDCHEQLSVQVHPDDATAQRLLGEINGKTESWYVIDAAPSSRICAGWKPGVTRADIEAGVKDGTIADCLACFQPLPGQCLHIPAGTVHALGGGVVLAEIQQTSDATFRLFDWNRVDHTGNSRPLHIELALASLNDSTGPVRPLTPQRILATDTLTRDQFVRCPYYDLDRIEIRQPWTTELTSLTAVMVVSGAGRLVSPLAEEPILLERGQTVLLPALMTEATFQPADSGLTLLWISLPD